MWLFSILDLNSTHNSPFLCVFCLEVVSTCTNHHRPVWAGLCYCSVYWFCSLHTGNVSDIYDVPRASVSPDEEGIYDDPYDILDMEIYDYPPDVTDLYRFLEESSLDTPEHSTRASTITVTTDRTSSTISEDSWRTMSLPPLPPGARPFSVISSDEYQVRARTTLCVCVRVCACVCVCVCV